MMEEHCEEEDTCRPVVENQQVEVVATVCKAWNPDTQSRCTRLVHGEDSEYCHVHLGGVNPKAVHSEEEMDTFSFNALSGLLDQIEQEDAQAGRLAEHMEGAVRECNQRVLWVLQKLLVEKKRRNEEAVMKCVELHNVLNGPLVLKQE